jgi:4-amino-4-deoxy-L-arabinose transferase-like glycosyltransferase
MRRDPIQLAPIAFALVGVVAVRLTARLALGDVPHVMDEIAYMFQARMFAGGHLTVPLHLPRGAFALWFVDDRVRTFSIFPPGWPVVLALGVLLRATAWVNPFLHGATTLLAAQVARALVRGEGMEYEERARRAALFAAALYGLSPQAVLLAASLMSHSLVALAAAAVLASGLHLTRSAPSPFHAAALGTALGVAAITRPLCGVALGVAVALFVALALRRRVLHPVHLAALSVPAVVLIALLGAYNALLTGSPLRFPQEAYFDEHGPPADGPNFRYGPGCNRLGFGPGHGCAALPDGMHTMAHARWNTGVNLTAWLWLVGGGPFAFALAFLAVAERRDRGARIIVLAVIPSVLLLYGLYWYTGTCYGARFYHAALPSLFVLAALGLDWLVGIGERRAAAIVFAAILLANGAMGWLAASEVSRLYWGTDDRFARLAAAWNKPPAMVLVAFSPGPPPTGHYHYTTFLNGLKWPRNIRALGALGVNSPDLDGPVVFARYHPALMPEIRARFPERQLWLYVMGSGAADRLVPYNSSGLSSLEAGAVRPKDNFDGFTIPPGYGGYQTDQDHLHSPRKVIAGSTWTPRRAAIRLASRATEARSSENTVKVRRSVALTP